MPEDRTPRILAGFKLHRTTTLLFSIFSRGTNFTKPDTICTISTVRVMRQIPRSLQSFPHLCARASRPEVMCLWHGPWCVLRLMWLVLQSLGWDELVSQEGLLPVWAALHPSQSPQHTASLHPGGAQPSQSAPPCTIMKCDQHR